MGFSSDFSKNRWKKARAQKEAYKLKTGNDISLREFYKNKNPLTQNIFKYEVTFEMNISGQDYKFFIPQESYTIYGYGSGMQIAEIEEMNKRAIAGLFRGKAINTVYDATKVNVRGVEESKVKYNEIDVNELMTNNTYSKNLPIVEVKKKSKGSVENSNSYGLNIWI